MWDNDFLRTAILFFVLLNPFLMSIYLQDLMNDLGTRIFAGVLMRAAAISVIVFALFAIGGEAIFTTALQVHFSSFLIFGGFIFLAIGLRYVFMGSEAIRQLRGGQAQHLAGSVAMPFIIGPGTISVSVWSGTNLGNVWGVLAIALGLGVSLVCLLVFKLVYDQLRHNNQRLLERYVDITGRITALWTGTFAVEMIIKGLNRTGVLGAFS